MPLVLAIANLKGGSSKTTTAAFLAHALAEAELSVLVVDADPQGSIQRWSQDAEWKIPVIGLPVRTIHAQGPGIWGKYDVVIIDTPPLEEKASIVNSALRSADVVLVPTAPTPIEVERLAAVKETLEEIGPLRPSGEPPAAFVLLTRTIPNAASTGVWREDLTKAGWTVLKTHVGRLESLSQAYGDPIVDASFKTAYGPVADELLEHVS